MLMNNDLIPRLQLTQLSAALQQRTIEGFEPLDEGEHIPTFSSIEDAFRFLNRSLRPKDFFQPTRRGKTTSLKYSHTKKIEHAKLEGMSYKTAFDLYTYAIQFILMYCEEMERYIWTTYEHNLMAPRSPQYVAYHYIITNRYFEKFHEQFEEANVSTIKHINR